MVNHNSDRRFFVAVTKGFKTMTGMSKNQVKSQITKRKIAKRNVLMFKCSSANGGINAKMLGRPKFKLEHDHFRILEETYTSFLQDPDQSS